MSTRLDSWKELATRETDGLLVSLLWSAVENRVKVAVADTRLRTRFEIGVASDGALDAFHHPFLYAGGDVPVATPARTREVAA